MKATVAEIELPPRVTRPAKALPKAPDLQIKIVLVPLDFSHASIQALKYTIPLAREFGAAIHLVHVQHADELTAIENAGGLMLSCADSIALMQDRLNEALPQPGRFWPDNCHIVSGKPYEEICRLAGRIEADLIVLTTTRGMGPLKHVFLGSTAERVVRYASCPVLVPRGGNFETINWDGSPTGGRFTLRKILAPVDFSDCSLAGVRYAARLAQRMGATLRLLHVVFPHTEMLMIDRASGDLTTVARAAKATARARMRKLVAMPFMRDVRFEVIIRTGAAIEEICRESGRPDIDLIVTATHGYSGFKHAFLGSVTEHVVRYAECPVLTVPSRGAF